ncbi:deoxyribonuclease II family protein [Andreprevotia chitinilytica]|uniref:deoxyribonuclease II family protein n=1 Tax=Andreprevotia chitinilytica TaxID=396808 RepID=UPI00054E42BB|nr:deoxyribonuclease II family protein [Andreprevotia chitinilytica]
MRSIRTRFFCVLRLTAALLVAATASFGHADDAPVPLLAEGHPVDWWFAFKFNGQSFPACSAQAPANTCVFGGSLQSYKQGASQQFVYASSDDATLQQGVDCIGTTSVDPLGATFGEIYNGSYHFVVWNDQFKTDPSVAGCGVNCGAPWGHSKGVLAWNDAGDGVVVQVSTPSWPGSGSRAFPRSDGNTLGCVQDNNIEYSQHFFALKLTKSDVVTVLEALQTASVVTDPTVPQLVQNGGPADIQLLVKQLGKRLATARATSATLSSGVQLIAKPSHLSVPPWQMVSSLLGGVPLYVANWWEQTKSVAIPDTTATTQIDCWDASLTTPPGAVTNAKTGTWQGVALGLTGGGGDTHNHAKVGVTVGSDGHTAIFGDMNQEGSISGKCTSAQNGRGGMFFVVPNPTLGNGVAQLIGLTP